MERVILIKYGELTTKKGNRNFFVKTLSENLAYQLKDYPVAITKDLSRMYLTFQEEHLDLILEAIHRVFGIHKYHVAYKVKTDLKVIEETLLHLAKEKSFSSFKVEVKRSDKSFELSSLELASHLGGNLLKNIPGIKVDVHHPEVLFQVEIREGYSYLYPNAYQGLGGYPVGTQPKGMLMLSGGIDSPVAGYLAMKRGIKLEAVYFEALPHTSLEARNKVIALTRKLAKYTKQINLHVVPFTKLQEAIYQKVPSEYNITIMRRMMYRITEQLAKRYKALAIINGESIGQVASQTLHSMSVINSVTSVPVIRPVACLDKLEIIDISKEIDTYETSILPFEDCCTIFVPKHPVINPNLEDCLKFEKNFDYETLIKETLAQVFTIKITKDEQTTYQDLL